VKSEEASVKEKVKVKSEEASVKEKVKVKSEEVRTRCFQKRKK